MSPLNNRFYRVLSFGILAATFAGVQFTTNAAISVQADIKAQDGQVAFKNQREKAIKAIEGHLTTSDHSAFKQKLESLRNPFAAPSSQDQSVTNLPSTATIPTPRPARPQQRPSTEPVVTANQILQTAGEALQTRVTGTIEAGGRLFMTPREGGFISPGSRIPVTEGTSNYTVIIESISERSFLLRLGNAQRRFPILDAAQ
ncbi:MAG: hypothetical protein MK080_02170 [Opitutales bacterium]|nr:hypothetical protein [Opitutales bacterium]NRA25635.1 hypothetical protein [Opitutales bacterium]